MKRNGMGGLLSAVVLMAMVVGGANAAGPTGSLVVYTSQPTDQMAAVVKAFNAAYPDIKIELFRSGTTEVMNKLQAEFAAGAPRADVVLIADAAAATQLKNEGKLYAYKDAPVKGLPKDLVDPDMTFFGTKFITTGIIYNTKLVAKAPTSWNDLLVAGVAKSLIMPSPLYSGAAAIHVGTVVQLPAFGWKYYETLADRGAVAGQGNGTVVEAVARGEKAYGIIIEYMAFNAKAKGSPVDFVFPKEGVSLITQPVAILKTSKNLAAAKAFVDWQLSKEAQMQSVEQGYYPAIPGLTPPKGYPKLDAVKVMSADPGIILKQDGDNKKMFADLFGG